MHYLNQSFDRAELAALYLAADVMVVTPLRDGMNLVAKEYVAARVDNGGALVLSEFAGAAAELTDAYLVNPHDLDGLKDDDRAGAGGRPAENRPPGCGRCAATSAPTTCGPGPGATCRPSTRPRPPPA